MGANFRTSAVNRSGHNTTHDLEANASVFGELRWNTTIQRSVIETVSQWTSLRIRIGEGAMACCRRHLKQRTKHG